MANKRSLKLAEKEIEKEKVVTALTMREERRMFADSIVQTTLVGLIATSISTLVYIGLDMFA